MPRMLHQARRWNSALDQYSQNFGRLMERHRAEAALVAARQEAVQEAEEARRAKLQTELANAALLEEVTVRSRTQSRLAYLAGHDPLTALPNRTLFSEKLAKEMEQARRCGRKLALLFIDLDNFKDVNDTLGHAAGDTLLQIVSARIEGELREMETVARMGGDEFAVLQTTLTHSSHARALAQRLISVLGEPCKIDGRSVFIGASIGITLFPDDADTVETLHRNADLAMYRAKSDGRNRCHFFDGVLNQEVRRRALLEQALREPALYSQLRLAYQPQVGLQGERITGVEALLRWQHPVHGPVSPGEFVPLAERCGMIGDIGTWVLRQSCQQAARWLASGLPPITVAVNVATAQFREGDIPRLVREVLAETGLPAPQLELEITETGIMHDMHVAAETLVALHELGVSLAIDDFGTGYSSLSYLRRLPVDRIKIDQSFVSDVTANEDAAVVATTIVKLAHNLRLEVVAEGVETQSQAAFVRDAGCNFAQGYFYGTPATPDDLSILRARSAALEQA